MKRIDIHTHSHEVSLCSLYDICKIIDLRKEAGLDGMVITNHAHPFNYDENDTKTFNMSHYETYLKGLEYAKKIGFKLFLGVEVTIDVSPIFYHILILGCEKDFFENAPKLGKLTQKELYEYAKRYDCFVIQAHPYREYCLPADSKYLDGFEINCNVPDMLHINKVKDFASKHNLKLVAGCDFHGKDGWPIGGLYIPNNISSNKDLRVYLKKTKKLKIFY